MGTTIGPTPADQRPSEHEKRLVVNAMHVFPANIPVGVELVPQ